MTKRKKDKESFYGAMYGYSRKDWNALKHKWNLELKSSGLKDVEKWTKQEYPERAIFLDNPFRNMRSNQAKIITQVNEKESYYRAISIVTNHTDMIPEKFKEMALAYANGQNFEDIHKKFAGTHQTHAFRTMFSSNKFKAKIFEAARALDEKHLNEDMEEIINDRTERQDGSDIN